MTFWSNTGEGLRRQPDNYYGLKVFCFVLIIYTVLQWVTGLRSLLILCPIYLFCQYTNKPAQAGHLEVSDKSGMTVEGLQEYYDEACLAVINNKWATSVLCSSSTSPKKGTMTEYNGTMSRASSAPRSSAKTLRSRWGEYSGRPGLMSTLRPTGQVSENLFLGILFRQVEQKVKTSFIFSECHQSWHQSSV